MFSLRLVGFTVAALWALLFLYLFVRLKSFPTALEISVVIGLLALGGLYILNRLRGASSSSSDPSEAGLTESKRLIEESRTFIEQLTQLADQSEENRQRLGHVYALMESTLEAVGDADKRHLAPTYLDHFVRPTHDWLHEYARLSTRVVTHADLDLKEAADRIPDVERSFASLNEQIHTSDVTNLALLNLEISSGLSLRAPSDSEGSR